MSAVAVKMLAVLGYCSAAVDWMTAAVADWVIDLIAVVVKERCFDFDWLGFAAAVEEEAVHYC